MCGGVIGSTFAYLGSIPIYDCWEHGDMVQVQVLTAQFRDSCDHGPMTFSSLMGSGVGFNGETLNFWLRNDRFDSCTPEVSVKTLKSV